MYNTELLNEFIVKNIYADLSSIKYISKPCKTEKGILVWIIFKDLVAIKYYGNKTRITDETYITISRFENFIKDKSIRRDELISSLLSS